MLFIIGLFQKNDYINSNVTSPVEASFTVCFMTDPDLRPTCLKRVCEQIRRCEPGSSGTRMVHIGLKPRLSGGGDLIQNQPDIIL